MELGVGRVRPAPSRPPGIPEGETQLSRGSLLDGSDLHWPDRLIRPCVRPHLPGGLPALQAEADATADLGSLSSPLTIVSALPKEGAAVPGLHDCIVAYEASAKWLVNGGYGVTHSSGSRHLTRELPLVGGS